jgi:LacI family transcriptional regulator
MLLAHLGGTPAPDEPVVLPTELIVRQSAPAS